MGLAQDNVMSFTGKGRISITLPATIPAPELYGRVETTEQDGNVVYDMDWTQDNMWQMAHCQVANRYWQHYPHMRVVSKAVGEYDYPGRFTPYHHQKRIVNFLTTNKRAFCFSDMGTGKTAAAIWAADYLLNLGIISRVLVVCPKSILYAAWQNDLRDILPDGLHQVRILDGSKDARIKRANSGGQWHVINFDGVKTINATLVSNKYDLVIVDESTAFKNHQCARWRNIRHLITDDTWVWAMTGTPCPQGPEDAYGQARLVVPWLAPRTLTLWRDKTMRRYDMHIWKPKDGWQEEVFNILQPAIYISKAEAALNLPPKVSLFRDVELTPDQNRALTALRKDFMTQLDNGLTVTAANAAVLFGKVQQVLTGAVYADEVEDEERQTACLNNSDRERVMVDIIREAMANNDAPDNVVAGKTLVFVPFRHAGTRIMEVLKQENISAVFINGATAGRKRGELINQFQTQADPQVIVAIPDAFSHGVTATAASTIIWYGAPTRTEVYLQANNRIDRPGQTQHMNVVHLCSGDIERRYYDNLINNEGNQQEVLNMFNDFTKGKF